MGFGVLYTCEKCGSTREVMLGCGFIFPQVYQQIMADIKRGQYGDEWKSLAASDDLVAVDAELRLYQCGCGYWETDYGLSLFMPKDREGVLSRKYGDKTVAELGGAPYVMAHEFEADYELLRERVHRCPECGREMAALGSGDFFPEELRCPGCRGLLHVGDAIRWD